MPNPLFAKFSQGENRVTASILAVFERISFALVERILQILCEDSNIPLLEIRNQFRIKGASGVPDGVIQASFAYWIETKIVQNAIGLDHKLDDGRLVNRQLKAHLDALEAWKNAGVSSVQWATEAVPRPYLAMMPNSPLAWSKTSSWVS